MISSAPATCRRRGSPTLLGPDDVRAWVDVLLTKKIGPQRMAVLKFLYTKTLWKPENVSFLAWPSDPKRLPPALAAEESERLLAAFTHAKYRVFFTLVYAAGLRLTEARRLETRDIQASRGVIHVRPENAKRKRERYVMLSPRSAYAEAREPEALDRLRQAALLLLDERAACCAHACPGFAPRAAGNAHRGR